MKRWFEEKMLRIAYWLVWKATGGIHSIGYHDKANDVQSAIGELVTLYYGPHQRD